MDDRNDWIEDRLTDAMKAATSDVHAFPEAVTLEFRKLLSEALQEPRKPAELDEIASALIAANRSTT